MEMIRAIFNTIDHTKRALQAFYENPPEIDDPLDYITKPDNEKFQKIDQAAPERKKWNDPEKLKRITGESLGAGVFRPVGSKLVDLTINEIFDSLKSVADDTHNPITKALYNKFTRKEIEQYGTEKFQIDKMLPHNQWDSELRTFELDINKPTGGSISPIERKFLVDVNKRYGPYDYIPDDIFFLVKRIQRKEAYDLAPSRALYRDLDPAIRKLEEAILEKQLTPEQIQQKSLASLVSIHQKNLLEEQKALQPTLKKIQERTAQLQSDGPIVKINDIRDRSADTFVLNNCVGSYSNPTGNKFIPVYHPGTGLQLASSKEINQGNHIEYEDKIRTGKSDIYSYRPNGIPILTIEIDRASGQAIQVLGQNNRRATPEEWAAIRPYLDKIQQRTVFENNPIERITLPEGP
jgi:hypothetical protein